VIVNNFGMTIQFSTAVVGHLSHLFCCYVTTHLKMRTCTVALSFGLDEVKVPFMASIQCFSRGNKVGSPQNSDEMDSIVIGTSTET